MSCGEAPFVEGEGGWYSIGVSTDSAWFWSRSNFINLGVCYSLATMLRDPWHRIQIILGSEKPASPLPCFYESFTLSACRQLILSIAVAAKKTHLRFAFPPMIRGRILERPLSTHRTPPLVYVISQRACWKSCLPTGASNDQTEMATPQRRWVRIIYREGSLLQIKEIHGLGKVVGQEQEEKRVRGWRRPVYYKEPWAK
jgi:hypothetical protein